MGKVQLFQKACYALKPKSLGKINPKELGLICPNGEIRFQSAAAASKYAKNWVTQPLKTKNPYERFVARQDNVVFWQKDGNRFSCEIDDIDLKNILSSGKSNITIEHGHPNLLNNNVASPISSMDCKFIHRDNAFIEIIAYDKNGNFSKLVKKTSGNQLPKDFLQKIENEVYPQWFTKRQNELIEKIKNNTITKAEENEFLELIIKSQELCHTKEIAQNTHKYWVNNANDLGLEYSTNYSWLG